MSYYKSLTDVDAIIGYSYNGDAYCPTCVPKTTIGQDVPAPLFESDAGSLADECGKCYTHIGDCDYYCGECGDATAGVYAVDDVGALCGGCAQPYIDADAADLGAAASWATTAGGGILISAHADNPDEPEYDYPYLATMLVLGGPADRYTIEHAIKRGQGKAY
jgi:hypothetical protein